MTTEDLAPFRVLVPLESYETPLSFTARVSHANGFGPLRQFCSLMEFDPMAIRSGKGDHLDRLAGHGKVDPVDLRRFATHSHARTRNVDCGGHLLRGSQYRVTTIGYCPACIAADLAREDLPQNVRAYARADWQFDFVTHCDRHGIELSTAKYAAEYDFCLLIARIRDAIEAQADRNVAGNLTRADAHFRRRLLCSPVGESYIDTLPLGHAIDLSETIGMLASMARSSARSKLPMNDLAAIRQVGFDIMVGGIGSILECIEERFRCHPITDRKSAYGDVYRILDRSMDCRELDGLRTAVREHALSQFPLKKGDNFLGPVDIPTTYTVNSAAREYGLTPSETVQVLVEHRIVDPSALNLPTASVRFRIKSARKCLEAASTIISSAEACEILGVDLWQLSDLETAGLLRGYRRTGMPSPTRYRRQVVTEFLSNVLASAVADVTSDMVDIAQAASFANCNFSEVVAFLEAGSLKHVARDQRLQGLASVRLVAEEVSASLSSAAELNLALVDKHLGATVAQVRLLVEAGLLPTVVEFNPSVRRYQRSVSNGDLRKFASSYATVSWLSTRLGDGVEIVRNRLAAAGAKPAFSQTELRDFYRFDKAKASL